MRDLDASLATRAAWLHFAGGLTQADVARRLGLSGLKAHRLIARASQEGLVKVYVDGDVAECLDLEARLSDRYGLDYCEVVPDFDQDELPLRALGPAGAQFLKRQLERGEEVLVGIGHGRTLAASVEHLPRTSAGRTRFVSLLGGITRKFAANPHDVIHKLAERTGAEAFVMPVPFFANSIEDRDVLLAQRGVADVLELARRADLLFVGIGIVDPAASLVATGMIEPAEIDEIKRNGAVGELLGHFFDEEGRTVRTTLSDRTLALAREDLEGRRIVAVAGGRRKVAAIDAVLKSRLPGGLITDERTARALAQNDAERADGGGRPRMTAHRGGEESHVREGKGSGPGTRAPEHLPA
ncbi:MAG: sugar-binding transcriptional regulator [Geminicoccaceae bacterium]|nr:sugar-binding transcriptional regulator [Geminicoccaceae bacterium]